MAFKLCVRVRMDSGKGADICPEACSDAFDVFTRHNNRRNFGPIFVYQHACTIDCSPLNACIGFSRLNASGIIKIKLSPSRSPHSASQTCCRHAACLCQGWKEALFKIMSDNPTSTPEPGPKHVENQNRLKQAHVKVNIRVKGYVRNHSA